MSWRNDQRTADEESEQNFAPDTASVEAGSSGISPADIYYILFRQKWKLLSFFALAVAGAVGAYFMRPPVYLSEAELLVKYVLESKPENGPGSQINSVAAAGRDAILSVEGEILTSRDVAEKVAVFVGPEKILAKIGGGDDRAKAVGVIMRGTKVDATRRSSVLLVTFRHPDPDLVQPVLSQLISSYRERHVKIHRGLGELDEILTQQTDQLGSSLQDSEAKLRDLKSKAGVISIEETKKEYIAQLTKINQDLINAEAQLAQRTGALKLIERAPQSNAEETNKTETVTPVTPEASQEYRNISFQLDTFRKKEAEMAAVFTGEYSGLVSMRESIANGERRKKELETQYPLLVGTVTGPSVATAQAAERDPAVQLAQIAGLEAQIKYLRSQLETRRKEVFSMDTLEAAITQLERERNLQQTNYLYFKANLDQARFAEELGAAKASNIDVVNSPTPPSKAAKETYKLVLMVFAALFALGVCLALLSELVIDQSIRKPADVTGKLNGPLFISIPRVPVNGKPLLVLAAGNRGLPLGDHAEASRPANDGNGLRNAGENGGTDSVGHKEATERKPSVAGLLGAKYVSPLRPGNHPKGASIVESTQEESLRMLFKRRASGVLPAVEISRGPSGGAEPLSAPSKVDDMGVREVTPWDPDYKLRSYAEGLRDRIITWFERRNLTHKPKLVAITSCNKGAGVTSIAAGLAAALSETGDGKVLLVDLNLEVGAAHPFYEGRPACGIMEALDRSQRRMAVVQSNLCVAAGTELNDNQPQTILPRRFTRLIPRLKASDYDYIIFDMLPVDQTSVTARLSGVMDMVLMVLESEKTALPVAKQAAALLREAQANVGFVLNKRRKYVPSWLHHEL